MNKYLMFTSACCDGKSNISLKCVIIESIVILYHHRHMVSFVKINEACFNYYLHRRYLIVRYVSFYRIRFGRISNWYI